MCIKIRLNSDLLRLFCLFWLFVPELCLARVSFAIVHGLNANCVNFYAEPQSASPEKYTLASGNWSDASIWNDQTLPVVGQDVEIRHSTVKLDQDIDVGDLLISVGGDLDLNEFNIEVRGETSIYGMLRDNHFVNHLNRSFQQKLCVYESGSFSSRANKRSFFFGGGIENYGLFSINNPNEVSVIFITENQCIKGNKPVVLDGNISISSGLTLINELSGEGELHVEGWINGADSSALFVNHGNLTFLNSAVSFSTGGRFDAYSFENNCVNYCGIDHQYIVPGNYQNLTLSDGNGNASNKYLQGSINIYGSFLLDSLTDFYPEQYHLMVQGSSVVRGRVYATSSEGMCTLSGAFFDEGAEFDGSVAGNVRIIGSAAALENKLIIGQCNFSMSQEFQIKNGGSLSFADHRGEKYFNSISLNSGAEWQNSGNSNVFISGDLFIDAGALFLAGNGTYCFSGHGKKLTGTIAVMEVNTLEIEGSLTNSISVLLAENIFIREEGELINETGNSIELTSLMGDGCFTQSSNSELLIWGDCQIDEFDADAQENKVIYCGSDDQKILGATYWHLELKDESKGFKSKTLMGSALVKGDFYLASNTKFDPMESDFTVHGNSFIRGVFDDDAVEGVSNLQNLDLSGGQIYGGRSGVVNVHGDLKVSSGNAGIGYVNLKVFGSTLIENACSISFLSNYGTKSFVGKVIISGPDGVWDNRFNESIEFQNGLEFNGHSFISGTGSYLFSTNHQVIEGESSLQFMGEVKIGEGVHLQNRVMDTLMGLCFYGKLNGLDEQSEFVNTALVNYKHSDAPMNRGILNAGTSGNVFAYSGADNQHVKGGVYYNVRFSSSGSKLLTGMLNVKNDLHIDRCTLDVSALSSYAIDLAGNWKNEGVFLARNGNLRFMGENQQLFNGNGEVFCNLEIVNTSLTLQNGALTVLKSLSMNCGKVSTGNFRLCLGTSIESPGTLNYTSGHISGKFERWLSQLETSYLFPVGSSLRNELELRCINDLNGGTLVVQYIEEEPSEIVMPIDDDGYIVNRIIPDAYWKLEANNSFSCGNFQLLLNAEGMDSSFAIDKNTRIIKKNDEGNWFADGDHLESESHFCRRNRLNGISERGTDFALAVRKCSGGRISIPMPEICSGDLPAQLLNERIPSGGKNYVYSWYYTSVLSALPGDENWVLIPDSDQLEYQPENVSQSLLFVRKAVAAIECIEGHYSNVIQLTVNQKPVTGNIFTTPN